MGPMQGNPLEQPGSADPYQSASTQIRDPGSRAAPEDRYDELTGEIKRRADFGLATGAVPVQRFKAGSLTSTDLDRGFDEYDLEDYEEESMAGGDAIGQGDPSQTQQPETREGDEVFQAHRYDSERLPLSDPFTQNLKPKFAEFVSRRNQIARGNF